ncbi:MAG: hypothetical protein II970_00425, partial [Paludibacteraceae bacterium]|nr:hypothetical protein [Paludibacteraceae bacterium]
MVAGGTYSVIEKGEGGGTVTPVEPEGDEVTVAQALEVIAALAENGKTESVYTVTGYVTNIKTAYSSQYNNITLEIADTKGGTPILTLFRVKPNADSDQAVVAGDKVQAVGQLQRYVANGNETPEMVAGGTYSVIEKGEGGGTTPVQPTGDEISVSDALTLINGLTENGKTDVTYTIMGYVVAITTEYSDQYNNITFTIADTKGGTVTVTVFRVKPTSDSDKAVAVGDKIVVTGQLQRYVANGKETPETVAGATFYIIEKGEGGGSVTPANPNYYQKVTTPIANWAGRYLIVYEPKGLAFNGGLDQLDAAGNSIEVEIENDRIAVTDETKAAEFTIAAYGKGYSIKSASGRYIGQEDNKNGLKAYKSDEILNLIALDADGAVIKSAGAYLRYNAASNNRRFRYYQSSTYTRQKTVQLYRIMDGSETPVTPQPTGNEITVAKALEVINGLASGATSTADYTVTGYVTNVKTAYSADYNNVTLEIADTKGGSPILTLFRVKPNAEADKTVAVGDKVTATGKLQRYAANGNETPEMAAGGTYSVIEKGEGGGTTPTPVNPEGEEVNVAKALEILAGLASGAKTDAKYTVTGYVTSIKDQYSDQYNNISIYIGDTKNATDVLLLYRVKPNADADKQVAVGDKVTAVVQLYRYQQASGDLMETVAGGTYSVIEKNDGTDGPDPVDPVDPAKDAISVADALAAIAGLAENGKTESVCKVVGYVIAVTDPFNSQYGNITFTIGDTKDATSTLTLFRVKPNADSDKEVKSGDRVVAVGQLQRFVKDGKETPEMVAGGTYSVVPETALEDAELNSGDGKFVIDGQLVIIRGGIWYNAQGLILRR